MKIKNILMFSGAILLTSVILVSCGTDDNYDFPGIDHERVYFDKKLGFTAGPRNCSY